MGGASALPAQFAVGASDFRRSTVELDIPVVLFACYFRVVHVSHAALRSRNLTWLRPHAVRAGSGSAPSSQVQTQHVALPCQLRVGPAGNPVLPC